MDTWKMAEILYDAFGEQEFTTSQIPPKAMNKLTRAMGIPKMPQTAARQRNVRVGRAIGKMEGRVYYIFDHEAQVKMHVSRPARGNRTRRFRFAPLEVVNYDNIPFSIGPLSRLQVPETGLTFQVALIYDKDYGYTVFCPALNGCISDGDDKAEALENIKECISLFLKSQAREIQRETEVLLQRYNDAGYPAELATVSVG